MIWIVIVHAVEAIGAFAASSMLLAAMWAREAPINDALSGAPMRKRKTNPALLDPRLVPTAMLTGAVPAVLSVWFLKDQGYDGSAMATGIIAMGLGWLNARRLTKSMRERHEVQEGDDDDDA